MALVLTQNAKFNPFTFQDLAAPYLLVDKAAGEVEEALDSTLSKSNLMRKYAEEEPNAEYSKAYKAYADNLEHQAEQFSKYGLSAGLRDSIRMARNNYGKVVTPIELAAAKREKIYEKRDPNAFYRQKQLSLQDVMDNNIDNSFLTEKDLTSNIALKSGELGIRKLQEYIERGYSSKDALSLVSKDLQKLRNEELKSLRLSDFSQDEQLKIARAIDAGIAGSFSGIAKEEYLNAKERASLDYQKQQLALSRQRLYNENVNRNIELKLKGYKLDKDNNIEIDQDSPYWKERGISFDKDGNKIHDLPGIGTAVETEIGYVITPNDGSDPYIVNKRGTVLKPTNKPDQEDAEEKRLKAKYPNLPIVYADNSNYGNWEAGTEGEAGDGTFHWFEIDSPTRDWGADFTNDFEPSQVSNIKRVPPSQVNTEAYEKIKQRVEKSMGDGKFDPRLYNFYEYENGDEISYVAHPKDNDPYIDNESIKNKGEEDIVVSLSAP